MIFNLDKLLFKKITVLSFEEKTLLNKIFSSLSEKFFILSDNLNSSDVSNYFFSTQIGS